MKKNIICFVTASFFLLLLMPIAAVASIRPDATNAYKLLYSYIVRTGTVTNNTKFIKTLTIDEEGFDEEEFNFFLALNDSTDHIELKVGEYNRTFCLDNEGTAVLQGDYIVRGIDLGYETIQTGLLNSYKCNITNYKYGTANFINITTGYNATSSENAKLNEYLKMDLLCLEYLMMKYVSPDCHWGSLGYRGLCSFHKSDNGTTQLLPTCEFDGFKEYRCQYCRAMVDLTILPATDHKWDAGVIQKKPTCTEKGKKVYTCKNDSTHTKTEEIPATGHKLVKTAAVKATCTKAGSKEYYKCSLCGKIYTDAKGTKESTKKALSIPALGHSFGEWKTVKKPTYTVEGSEQRICKHDSSHKETRKLKKLPPVIGLVKNNGKWVYMENGKVIAKTGLTKRADGQGGWYYVEKGIYRTNKTGLTKRVDGKGGWFYVEKGVYKTNRTGLTKRVDGKGGWYYVRKGKLDATKTGVVKRIDGKGGLFYVRKGVFQNKFTGRIKDSSTGKTYNIVKGVVK